MASPTSVLTIAWDVDDVLNGLTAEWYSQARSNACAWPDYQALLENPPHRLLRMSLEEYLRSLDTFRRSRYSELAPSPAVLDWLRQHGGGCRHIALSSVPRAFADVTAGWVIRHFGQWINTFAFVASAGPRADGVSMAASKRDYLRWWGKAGVLVEDRAETLDAVADLGMRGILIPQPWNAHRGTAIAAALDELTAQLPTLR